MMARCRAYRFCVTILLLLAGRAIAAPVCLDALLEPIRQANGLPALAAAVVRGGEMVAVGAVGVRKAGSPQRVTPDDKWHIGSCTKSMTAALAAMLVEDGAMRWDTTLAEMFPDLESQMQPGWRDVTLEQLLAHRGGAPHELNEQDLWGRLWQRADQPPREQRRYLRRELLTKHEPVSPPGTKHVYSNAGYALVGHALEEILDRPWEDLLRDRLFVPLGMTGAGFGAPASVGAVDQPWGHKAGDDGAFEPVAPGLHADNPAAISPGGTVHCRLADLAQYAAWHLAGARGEGTLLHPETFERLHTPLAADSEYALGWIATERPWGGGLVLTHAGSNTMFYAVIWIAPNKDFAAVVCTNAGGPIAERATDTAAATLIGEYLSPN